MSYVTPTYLTHTHIHTHITIQAVCGPPHADREGQGKKGVPGNRSIHTYIYIGGPLPIPYTLYA
jgi:ABC-type nickel/cobalt efflux system permease component RcnA